MRSDVCEFYKLLHNPLRLEMLRCVYAARDGMNVGLLVDAMTDAGIKQPCVSQYLKQLEKAGVVVRRRAGRYANYFADASHADARVRKAVETVVWQLARMPSGALTEFFGAMMNPFRAAVVCELCKRGPMDAPTISGRFEHPVKYLKRDLQAAVDAGLLAVDGGGIPVYRFVPPSRGSFAFLISLCA